MHVYPQVLVVDATVITAIRKPFFACFYYTHASKEVLKIDRLFSYFYNILLICLRNVFGLDCSQSTAKRHAPKSSLCVL